jgi:hypothetical protein
MGHFILAWLRSRIRLLGSASLILSVLYCLFRSGLKTPIDLKMTENLLTAWSVTESVDAERTTDPSFALDLMRLPQG